MDHNLHMRKQCTFVRDVTVVVEYIERRIICKVYKVVLLFFSHGKRLLSDLGHHNWRMILANWTDSRGKQKIDQKARKCNLGGNVEYIGVV